MSTTCVCDPVYLDGYHYQQWIGTYLGICAYTWRDFGGIISTFLSITFWVILTVPQLNEVYQLKSVEGVSFGLLFWWSLADTLGLMGLILTNEINTLFWLSVYYCFADILCVSQWLYYRFIRPKLPRGRIVPTISTSVLTENIEDERDLVNSPYTNVINSTISPNVIDDLTKDISDQTATLLNDQSGLHQSSSSSQIYIDDAISSPHGNQQFSTYQIDHVANTHISTLPSSSGVIVKKSGPFLSPAQSTTNSNAASFSNTPTSTAATTTTTTTTTTTSTTPSGVTSPIATNPVLNRSISISAASSVHSAGPTPSTALLSASSSGHFMTIIMSVCFLALSLQTNVSATTTATNLQRFFHISSSPLSSGNDMTTLSTILNTFTTTVADAVIPCEKSFVLTEYQKIVGRVFTGLASVFNTYSRIPQVLHNYNRKRTDGLNPWFVILQFWASACFLTARFLPSTVTFTKAWWFDVFPWCFASGFGMICTSIIWWQIYWYGNNEIAPKREQKYANNIIDVLLFCRSTRRGNFNDDDDEFISNTEHDDNSKVIVCE